MVFADTKKEEFTLMCGEFVVPRLEVAARVDVPRRSHMRVESNLHVSTQLQQAVCKASYKFQLVVSSAEY